MSTMTLVREEHLDTLRNEFESITSIHLYSVGPWQLKDSQMLSDATREIRLIDADRDLIEYGKIYGSATNPNVKRRSGRRPPPITVPEEVERASVAPPKSKAIETTKQSSNDKAPSSSKPESKPSQSQASKDFFAKDPKSSSTQATTTKKAEAKPPTLKRDSSSIFKAFAKTKPPKLKNEDSDSVTGASGMDSANATDAEDHPMKDVDDDDEEDDYVVPTSKSDRNTRKEREAALKAMMDDDDEEDEEKVSGDSQNDTNAESESQEAPAPPQEKETVTVEGGRRRGRRRVMKKRTMKDEEGYLGMSLSIKSNHVIITNSYIVTKEEATWESFSEDEPVAPKPKPAVIVAPVKKGKGEAAKKGQGSIMSFFGKPKK